MPFLGSWCAQCGPDVSVDEDGCCNACGCSAVGEGADAAHTTISDLRDRLRVLAPMVCEGCGCATQACDGVTEAPLCCDCLAVDEGFEGEPEYPAACVSVGLRALCGRLILEGC